eukprot:m.393491 g.393491  ORF g.393491 m.393491 type:complete len:580 (-) comp21087_c1_seq26:270-2009(-)
MPISRHYCGVYVLMLGAASVIFTDAARTDDFAAEKLRAKADDIAKTGNLKSALSTMNEAMSLASKKNVKVRLSAAMLNVRANNKDEGKALYREAIKIGENSAPDRRYVSIACSNLCVELQKEGHLEDAHALCKQSAHIGINGFWYPYKTLGLIEERWSMMDDARNSYATCDRMKPDDAVKLHIATMLPLVYTSPKEFKTRLEDMQQRVQQLKLKSDFRIDNPMELITVPHFYAAFFGENNVHVYKQIADIVLHCNDHVSGLGRVSYVAPHVQKQLPWHPSSNRKIRVGFSSMFFRVHASGKMIQGIIEGLSRTKFEVVVFCIKESLGAPQYRDAVAKRIRARADKYIELPKPRGLAYMQDAIAKERLDVLVYAENGMDPGNYLLSFARLAPVQVVTHGHASTTGIPTLDYFVSYKPFERPDAQKFYSEKLVTFSDFSPYYKAEVLTTIQRRKTRTYLDHRRGIIIFCEHHCNTVKVLIDVGMISIIILRACRMQSVVVVVSHDMGSMTHVQLWFKSARHSRSFEISIQIQGISLSRYHRVQILSPTLRDKHDDIAWVARCSLFMSDGTIICVCSDIFDS